jgi:hypothetical protein
MSATFVAVCGDSLRDALTKATAADTIHTAFPPPGHYPRLFVSGEKWAVVSWSATDTNGRWRFVNGSVVHTPSPPDPDTLKYPETKVG